MKKKKSKKIRQAIEDVEDEDEDEWGKGKEENGKRVSHKIEYESSKFSEKMFPANKIAQKNIYFSLLYLIFISFWMLKIAI